MVRRAAHARFTNETASLAAWLALCARADFVSPVDPHDVARLRDALLLLMKRGEPHSHRMVLWRGELREPVNFPGVAGAPPSIRAGFNLVSPV